MILLENMDLDEKKDTGRHILKKLKTENITPRVRKTKLNMNVTTQNGRLANPMNNQDFKVIKMTPNFEAQNL